MLDPTRFSPSYRGPGRSAFTLVELLVVIAIIALLLSILLPSLSRARDVVLRMTCGTNLRAFGQAESMYAGDHKVYAPNQRRAFTSGWTTNQPIIYRNDLGGWWGLPHLLSEYLGDMTTPVFACPAVGSGESPMNMFATNSDFEVGQGGGRPWATANYSYWVGEPGNQRNDQYEEFYFRENGEVLTAIDEQPLRPGEANARSIFAQDILESEDGFTFGNHSREASLVDATFEGGRAVAEQLVADDPNGDADMYEGFNTVFGDGHVRFLAPDQATRVTTAGVTMFTAFEDF